MPDQDQASVRERPEPASTRPHDTARGAPDRGQAEDEDRARPPRGAGADEVFPFGRPGRPLRADAFLFGFTGALGAFTAWFVVRAVVNARSVLLLIAVSLFLAIGLNPAVEALQRRGLTRRWAIGLVFLAVIAFFVLFGFAVVPPLTTQTTAFVQHLPDYVHRLQTNRRIAELDRHYHLLAHAQQYLTSASLGEQAFGGILGVGKVVVTTAFSGVTMLILTLYFLGSLTPTKEMFYRLVPRTRRARARLLGDEILARIGGYVGGQLLIAAIAGTASFVYLVTLGVPYALALALVVAITDLIPMVGATIGAVIVSVVGFLTSVELGLACAVFYLAYQQVENYLVYPRIMKRSVDMPRP